MKLITWFLLLIVNLLVVLTQNSNRDLYFRDIIDEEELEKKNNTVNYTIRMVKKLVTDNKEVFGTEIKPSEKPNFPNNTQIKEGQQRD